MARAWVAALAVAAMVCPDVADAQRRSESRYWTEAKARKVRQERSELAKVARRAMPAVVSITTVQPPEDGKGDEQTGLGSGFVIDPSGFILTSAHVIEGASEIRIRLLTPAGFEEEHVASIVGVDKQTDFALLKVDARRKLPVLPFGRSSDVAIADWVVVIGNPFGLGHSVSVGVVSFKGRTDVTPSGLEGFFDYLQTDAAINPGNSGGPVLDLNGNVVAVANAVNVSGQGIGFAIPIEVAKSVIPHLIREGEVRRGWVGISIQDLTPDLAAKFGNRRTQGVLVSEVIDHSPAARAGLRVGDVITRVDGAIVKRSHALRWRVSNKGAGKRVKLRVMRDGRPRWVTLQLEEQPSIAQDNPPDLTSPEDAAPAPVPPVPRPRAAEKRHDDKREVEATRLEIGAVVRDVDEVTAVDVGLAIPMGALVEKVEPQSVGDEAGLESGDVVLKVNRTEIASRDDLIEALSRVHSGEWVRVFVRRDREMHALTFKKP